MKKLLLVLFVVSALFSLNAQTATPFKDGDTVCFLGDSITHQGGYSAFVYDYYATRFPGQKISFNNCGIAGDSAGGAIKRLDWDVLAKSPNKVTIMLGMNDVGRNSYGEGKTDEKSKARQKRSLDWHKKSMKKILDKLKEKNTEIILITPSPYDQEVEVKTKNLKGVNDALGICAEFCKEQTKKYNTGLVDFHGPMTALNRKMQKSDPSKSLIGRDRVHPHLMGHQVMAYHFLKDQGVTPEVATVEIDFAGKKVAKENNCSIKNLNVAAKDISFDYLAKALPYPASKEYKGAQDIVPITADLNQEIIQVKGLPKADYKLSIDGKKVCDVNADQLNKGFNIATLATPQQKQSQKIHNLIMKRRAYENKLRDLAKLEIRMRGKKVDPSDEKARAKFLEDLTVEIQKSPHKNYYLGLIKRYKANKSKEAEIKDKVKQLKEQLNKANKPVLHSIAIKQAV